MAVVIGQHPRQQARAALEAGGEKDGRLNWREALGWAEGLTYAGHDDWRLPTIKELYSLILFTGIDPDPSGTDTSRLTPFLDDAVFTGKPVAVFATYKLAVGSTLRQLAIAAESAGGKVTGMYKVKGPNVPDGFESWVDSLDSSAAI